MDAGQRTQGAAQWPLGGKGCARVILLGRSRHLSAHAGPNGSAFASRPRPPPRGGLFALLDETSLKDLNCSAAAGRGFRPGSGSRNAVWGSPRGRA